MFTLTSVCRLILASWACAHLCAQTEYLRLVGNPADGFGAAVLGPGDLDLDGYVDVLVGAPQGGGGAGAVHVYSGRDGRLRLTLTDPGSAGFGTRLRSAGDVDRDGHPDFWGESQAHLTVWSGRTLTLLGRVPAAPMWDAGGDVDGDRVPDLVLGIGGPASEVWLVSGRDLSLLARLPVPYLQFVRWAGDVDADGRTDLLVGDLTSSARVSLIAANDGRTIRQHRAVCIGQPMTAGPAGDQDGDGTPDYYTYETTDCYPPITVGVVTVVSGGSGARIGGFAGRLICAHTTCLVSEFLEEPLGFATLDGTGSLCALTHRVGRFGAGPTATVVTATGREVLAIPGAAAVLVGDIDRDGASDVAVADTGAGTVTVLSLQPHRKLAEVLASTEAPPLANYGRVFELGDLDGDGTADFAVAFPTWTYSIGSSVTCNVVSGANFSRLFSLRGRTLAGTVPSVQVADAGDLNGDGRPDILFTVANDTGAVQPDQGGAYSSTGSPLFAFSNPDWSYGTSVCGGIDWNQDGSSDVVISATTFAHVLSGRDQSVLFSWSRGGKLKRLADLDGDGRPDLAFGDTVLSSGSGALLGARVGTVAWADAGDVDGDRTPDVWSATAAGLECISGRTWFTLRTLAWPFPNPSPTLASGDWDADSVADLAVGSEAENLALVVSGRDGRELFRYRGRGSDGFGASVGLATSPLPGRSHLAVAAPLGGPYGFGYAFLLADARFPPGASEFGVPCGRSGAEPALSWTGGPARIGATCALRVTGQTSSAVVVWGGSERDWNGTALPLRLAVVGVPACVLQVSPTALVVGPMTPPLLTLPIGIPLDPTLLGAQVAFQSALVGATLTDAGFANAVRITIAE